MKESIILLLILALFSCAKPQKSENDNSPLPVKMIPVTVREAGEEVTGFGSLSFLKKFELLSPLEGVLETLYYREGDSVKKGCVVGILKNPQVNLAARRAEDTHSQALSALDLATARLRDSEFQAEARLLENEKSREELEQARRILAEEKRKSRNRETLYEAGGLSDEAIREERFRITQAETQILLMERELEIRSVGLRADDLRAAGFAIPTDKDELRKALVQMATSAIRAEAASARANLEAAAREMESCRLMEEELTILSPGTGTVGARYAEEGERIKRDDKILTILDTGSLYAIFPVPESEAPKLKKGMSARVISGAEENCEGTVDLVAPQADNQSFTFLVRILLGLREESPLRPGMFARVSIPLDSPRKITVIPEAALASKKENSGKVFTIQSNLLSERNVVLGTLLGNEREIISGLMPGEVVALGPGPAFREGLYVSPSD